MGWRESKSQGAGRNSADYEGTQVEGLSRSCRVAGRGREKSDALHNSLHNPGLGRLTRGIVGNFFDWRCCLWKPCVGAPQGRFQGQPDAAWSYFVYVKS
jgi:hypothetical protein